MQYRGTRASFVAEPPLKPKDIWAIRIHLQNRHAVRDLAMFNLAIDSKLRGCDLVSVRVRDIAHGSQILPRAMRVMQKKTQRPIQFELTEPTRSAVAAWLEKAHLRGDQYPFPSRIANSPHVSTRQYARIVHQWVEAAGLDSSAYGTHSMRRTKATLIYQNKPRTSEPYSYCSATANLRAQSDTSGSRSTTRWRSRSKLTCDRAELGRDRRTWRSQTGQVRTSDLGLKLSGLRSVTGGS